MNSLVSFFGLACVLTNLFTLHGSSWVDLPTSVGFNGLFYAMWCYWGLVISFEIAAIHPYLKNQFVPNHVEANHNFFMLKL